MNDTIDDTAPAARAARKPRAPKPRKSAVEALTPEELQTLRLDENARAEFDACVQRFSRDVATFRAFAGEDVAAMDDARYEQHSAAEADMRNSGMAVVHFMAPRILRMRDGAAKRKWRSFLTKFRKDENLG